MKDIPQNLLWGSSTKIFQQFWVEPVEYWMPINRGHRTSTCRIWHGDYGSQVKSAIKVKSHFKELLTGYETSLNLLLMPLWPTRPSAGAFGYFCIVIPNACHRVGFSVKSDETSLCVILSRQSYSELYVSQLKNSRRRFVPREFFFYVIFCGCRSSLQDQQNTNVTCSNFKCDISPQITIVLWFPQKCFCSSISLKILKSGTETFWSFRTQWIHFCVSTLNFQLEVLQISN